MALATKTAALILLFTGFAAPPAVSQPRVTLLEAARCLPPAFAPALAGRAVTVTGVVSQRPAHILAYVQVPLQDASFHGLVLDAEDGRLDSLLPGDEVDASGIIGQRAGLAVLNAASVRVVAKRRPPEPLSLALPQTLDLRYVGVFVTTEGVVSSVGRNGGGEVIMLDGDSGLKVFRPQGTRSLQRFERGDRIRVFGFTALYAPQPPYNRNFEIIIESANSVALLSKRSPVPAALVLLVALGALVATGFWLLRVRRMKQLRDAIQALTKLGEQMIGGNSPFEILARLTRGLPDAMRLTGVRLFLFHKEAQTLEKVPTPDDPEPHVIPFQDAGDTRSGAVLCCRHKALLSIPDSRSASARRLIGEQKARSFVFVPMFAHEDLFGVLELRNEAESRSLRREESAALQHLANQVAAALKLAEQQQLREALSRSEKLAAAGLLISSVVGELRQPIDAIARLAERLGTRDLGPEAAEDASAIANEARQAAQTVSRLAAFAWQRVEAQPVDLHRLLETVLETKDADWRQNGIERRLSLAAESVSVLAAEAQLEQVLISLLKRLESALADAPRKWVSLSTRLLSRRVLLEATAPTSAVGYDNPAGELGMDICRSIIQGFGGELRWGGSAHGTSRYEIELPLSVQPPPSRASSQGDLKERPLNILLLEPEPIHQRHLVVLLAARGHRVVPLTTAEEAADLAQRMAFDLIFSTVRPSGLNWLELFERVRPLVPSFVLLTEGFDPPLAVSLAHVLRKPVEPAELDRLLDTALTRGATPRLAPE